ncbi:MAG: nuclear transport factor 2 family protein [Bryobacteraceae bacterium]
MKSDGASGSSGVTRRSTFTAAGLGLAAMAGMQIRAEGAELTAAEKANVQVVNDFCAAWPSHNIDRIMSFFAEDCAYRMSETQQPNQGRRAVLDRIRSFVHNVGGFEVIETFAKGPMVFNERHDHFTGLPLKMWHGVGVFFLKEGKIVEWYDYTISIDRA